MARRTCPVCPKRYAGLVDPDCPVCEGIGVIALHPVALHRSEAAVVSRAVEIYLETSCREAAGELPPGDARYDALVGAVDRLKTARVIDAPLGVAEPDRHDTPSDTPSRRLADLEAHREVVRLDLHPRPQDTANLDAAPTIYGPDDRPRASGLLPQVSANGYPSHLAKAADPTDALGPDTRAQAYERASRDRGATVLATAVDRILAIQTRRATAATT